jgi:hypothetical protein
MIRKSPHTHTMLDLECADADSLKPVMSLNQYDIFERGASVMWRSHVQRLAFHDVFKVSTTH